MTPDELAGRRLVAVFPHPDDEAWAAGGLLRRAVDAGADVHLVTLSAGEAGTDRVGRRSGEELAGVRADELSAACVALGITSNEIVGLPDGRIEEASAYQRLSAIFAARAPDLVVGFDDDGAYGHGDHVLASRAMRGAARAVGVERVLCATFARGLFEGTRDALLVRRPELIHEDYRRGPLGRPESPADLVVVLSPEEALAKRAALSAHASQLGGRGIEGFLAPGVFAAVAERERYRVVGRDD
jgi:N-acetyl-1-D-myo-inositol-2-amino-2-deoxy-alpha-D-glucopyranoside deacetylase